MGQIWNPEWDKWLFLLLDGEEDQWEEGPLEPGDEPDEDEEETVQ